MREKEKTDALKRPGLLRRELYYYRKKGYCRSKEDKMGFRLK
jgi:hypothetical protein